MKKLFVLFVALFLLGSCFAGGVEGGDAEKGSGSSMNVTHSFVVESVSEPILEASIDVSSGVVSENVRDDTENSKMVVSTISVKDNSLPVYLLLGFSCLMLVMIVVLSVLLYGVKKDLENHKLKYK